MDILKIPFLENCAVYERIEEGFSDDVKWCVNQTY